jgi:proteasome assembly chaperone (PAC2) family protein
MPARQLTIHERPDMQDARMVMGFSGWMDGGDVSTGTVEHLVRALGAKKLADIDPEDFYITNFPGPMEVSALFRPHTTIDDGLVTDYRPPSATFYAGEAQRLVLFEGREPNFRWADFAECVFTLVRQFDVRRVYFIGSVAGVVPHTREPRLRCSASEPDLQEEMRQQGIAAADYDGPAGISTYLTWLAPQWGIEMVVLVAEIPAYVQGRNPVCIESVARRVSALLSLQLDLDELRSRSDAFEHKLNEVVQDRDELLQLIEKLEHDYDNEVFDTQMGDLKAWLERQGIRLD